MWIYYEDKGKYIGMTKNRQAELINFLKKAKLQDELIILKNVDVKLPNFDYGLKLNVIFDIPSFSHKINLDCLNCDKVHAGKSCCCGAPYPFDDIIKLSELIYNGSLLRYVNNTNRKVLELCKSEHTIDYIYDYNKQTFKCIEDNDGIFQCPLRADDRCGYHRYLLEHDQPYYTKPCTWMYPYDCVIELDKKLKPVNIFNFMLCKRTANISRWGQYSYKRHCLDDKLNEEIAKYGEPYYSQYYCDKQKYFKSEDYEYSYVLYGNEINYLFGGDIYDLFIKEMMK